MNDILDELIVEVIDLCEDDALDSNIFREQLKELKAEAIRKIQDKYEKTQTKTSDSNM